MKNVGLSYLTFLVFAVGCGRVAYDPPDLGGLYNRAARSSQYRNAVIVIPGLLGSKLLDKESGRIVWGAFEGGYANPKDPEGARLIALPMKEGVALSELKDAVYPNGALDRVKVRILGLPYQMNAYVEILSTLGVAGYRDETLGMLGGVDYGDEHFTCFQFDYDWRLDNVENAKQLHEFILEKRAYIQDEYKKRYGVENYDVKFDIVAHSMGGYIARYYVRYGAADLPEDGSIPEVTWEGAKYVDKVVIIGTANAGAVGAFLQLVNGKDIGPFLPKYEAAIIGTMPSVYQHLPRARHKAVRDETGAPLDLMDPVLWEKMGWGLSDPRQDKVLSDLLPNVKDPNDRHSIALDHLKKSLNRADQFQRALDSPAEPPEGLSLNLIAGDAVPTDATVVVDRSTGEIEVSGQAPGDGSVLRSSALMDERIGNEWTPKLVTPIKWSNFMFLFTDHLGMTKDPAFTDNVLFLLLEQPD